MKLDPEKGAGGPVNLTTGVSYSGFGYRNPTYRRAEYSEAADEMLPRNSCRVFWKKLIGPRPFTRTAPVLYTGDTRAVVTASTEP